MCDLTLGSKLGLACKILIYAGLISYALSLRALVYDALALV
jgi:hypothetical protein